MATWRQQYLEALKARDAVESVNLDLYDYCTRLADAKAELEKQARMGEKVSPAEEPPEPVNSPGWGIRRVTSTSSPATGPDSPNSAATTQLAQLRQDLSTAQTERSDLQNRYDMAVQSLDTYKTKAKTDAKRVVQLNASISQLTIKLRDREEELRGKAKLIDNVQDENVTLNLQLNMAEEQGAKLKKENQELVDRWMARMGREADRMNEEGKFG